MKLVRFISGRRTYVGAWVREGLARRLEGDVFGACAVTGEHLAIDRLLVPVVPTDILCIGLNYRDHAAEAKSEIPAVPMLFIKSSNTLAGPGDVISVPGNSKSVDYEGELCVVIGKAARDVPVERALDHVYGYSCANDVSARDWQKDKALGGGQFARGKSFDGFCPIGPWVVTRDEVPDPQKLAIRCLVNGQVMQQSNTAEMIFGVAEIISSLSQTMTLRPGAVILTGTPAGVAAGRRPPPWLKTGDRVAVEIEGVGALINGFE